MTKNLPLFSSSSLEEPESILVAQWDELDIQVVTFEPKVDRIEIRIRLSCFKRIEDHKSLSS